MGAFRVPVPDIPGIERDLIWFFPILRDMYNRNRKDISMRGYQVPINGKIVSFRTLKNRLRNRYGVSIIRGHSKSELGYFAIQKSFLGLYNISTDSHPNVDVTSLDPAGAHKRSTNAARKHLDTKELSYIVQQECSTNAAPGPKTQHVNTSKQTSNAEHCSTSQKTKAKEEEKVQRKTLQKEKPESLDLGVVFDRIWKLYPGAVHEGGSPNKGGKTLAKKKFISLASRKKSAASDIETAVNICAAHHNANPHKANRNGLPYGRQFSTFLNQHAWVDVLNDGLPGSPGTPTNGTTAGEVKKDMLAILTEFDLARPWAATVEAGEITITGNCVSVRYMDHAAAFRMEDLIGAHPEVLDELSNRLHIKPIRMEVRT